MNSESLSCLLILAFAVTACQNDSPSSAVAASANEGSTNAIGATADVAGPVWDESAAPIAGTRIVISPDPVSFCEGRRQEVEVEWDVTTAAPAHLQLWIENASGQRKLWAATKSLAGSKRTGAWTGEGTRFVILDGSGQRVINSTTVTAATCP